MGGARLGTESIPTSKERSSTESASLRSGVEDAAHALKIQTIIRFIHNYETGAKFPWTWK